MAPPEPPFAPALPAAAPQAAALPAAAPPVAPATGEGHGAAGLRRSNRVHAPPRSFDPTPATRQQQALEQQQKQQIKEAAQQRQAVQEGPYEVPEEAAMSATVSSNCRGLR